VPKKHAERLVCHDVTRLPLLTPGMAPKNEGDTSFRWHDSYGVVSELSAFGSGISGADPD